ncbi:unnamed protein product [Arabidopsis lyrata]|uniref:uncharacterized protein LOC110230501 n=1 Tax=Arabidopsis lyrata subsp. lyrata TaxID=81972 RepID=UPI000A29BCA1|nr:uncharacterized protein LOC110230501 [Arabidopsis lyrata subsp. lyrata]CAH8261296.1 unnamed protein product [Arabidopsis lyrata]|eukprot:XP_020889387.1 uncharacterized protein LOC110230501 [Arabidopsis lyrata subsp. lyrata]
MSLKKRALESKNNESHKSSHYYRCLSFSFIDSSTEEKKKPLSLNRMDSKKVKAEIVKWAKRVAAYARQLSSRKQD